MICAFAESWMGLELTWISIAASLLMAMAGICIFVYAVRKDYFRDIEDARFHVFWSDLEETVDSDPLPPANPKPGASPK
jgi:hypothetical protein